MEQFEMVAKTLAGLEEVLAEELRGLGALNVEPGRRMVSFEGDLEMLYRANLCCRTALRILKPFYKFTAHTPDELYEQTKEYDWSTLLSPEKTFCIDSVVNSEDFTHSQFVTYKAKDAIVDWFRDRYGDNKRPGVRLKDADIMINVHISAGNVTLSLDSSGESLHKRGYKVANTEAPINEVLAAGIILMSGWRGDCPFVDPMCGSGTFVIEAAMIAANINPGIYRKSFAFETWPDFDADLFDSLYNDDSGERDVAFPIIGADISAAAVEITNKNAKSAGVSKYIELRTMPIAKWEHAPKPAGVLVTNPPYGERISAPDMEGLYDMLGNRLKNVFQGYHAWVIGYRDEYFQAIGLAPSQKIQLMNGQLECQLREYEMFEGTKRDYLAAGGSLRGRRDSDEDEDGGYSERRVSKRERKEDRTNKERKFRGDSDERRGDRRERKGERKDDRRRFDRDDRRKQDHDERPERWSDRKERNQRWYDKKGRDRDEDRTDERRRDDRRDDRRRDNKRFDRKEERRFDKRSDNWRDRRDSYEDEPENPLAKRRNPDALKSIQNRQPSLPPSDGPVMRSRGWKKK